MKSRAFARRVDGLGRRLSMVRRPECWDVNEPGVKSMDWAFGCGKAPTRCCTGRSMADFQVEDALWGAGWRKGGRRHRRARFLFRCHCIGAADGAGVSTRLRRLQRGWPLPGIVNCARTSWSGRAPGVPDRLVPRRAPNVVGESLCLSGKTEPSAQRGAGRRCADHWRHISGLRGCSRERRHDSVGRGVVGHGVTT